MKFYYTEYRNIITFRYKNEDWCFIDADNSSIYSNKEILYDRIKKIKNNLIKCGSLEMILSVGGEGAKAYLNKTYAYLCAYLIDYQLGDKAYPISIARLAYENVKKLQSKADLVRKADIKKIEEAADILKKKFDAASCNSIL